MILSRNHFLLRSSETCFIIVANEVFPPWHLIVVSFGVSLILKMKINRAFSNSMRISSWILCVKNPKNVALPMILARREDLRSQVLCYSILSSPAEPLFLFYLYSNYKTSAIIWMDFQSPSNCHTNNNNRSWKKICSCCCNIGKSGGTHIIEMCYI